MIDLSLVKNWNERLNPRERLVLLSGAVLLLLLGGYWLVDSEYRSLETMRGELGDAETQLLDLDHRLDARRETLSRDPDQQERKRIQSLKDRIRHLELRLQSLTERFIAPDRMSYLLHQILMGQKGLRWVRLRTLPVRALRPGSSGKTNEKETKENGKDHPKLFIHPFELEFDGAYLDAMRYMEHLEGLSSGIHWESFELLPGAYPRHRFRLRLRTLGPVEEWIGV